MTPPLTAEQLLATINQPMPFSLEAERGILSCWFQNPDRLLEGAMVPEAFYNDATRTFAAHVMEQSASGKPLDPILLTNSLRDKGILERVGGAAAVMDIFTFTPSPANYRYYRQIVSGCFLRRRVIQALAAGIKAMQETSEGVEAVLEGIRSDLNSIETDDENAELPCRSSNAILNDVLDKAQERADNPGKLLGVSTGFAALDALTGGLQRGRLWTILAESSDGKSSLCRQIIENACGLGHAGVIYTYEMMDDEEMERMLCSTGRIDGQQFKTGKFTRDEYDRLNLSTKAIQKWDISIVDVAGKNIEDIHRDIRRRKKRLREGQELVVEIDYIQLAKTKRKFERRQMEVGYITTSTKQCAKVNRCTILMPSQVNEKGEGREAMDIEQDSDVEIKIRKIQLDPRKAPKPWEAAAEPDMRRDLWLAKNRSGQRHRKVDVRFVGKHYRFEPEHTTP